MLAMLGTESLTVLPTLNADTETPVLVKSRTFKMIFILLFGLFL
jgi:hypothetical protein